MKVDREEQRQSQLGHSLFPQSLREPDAIGELLQHKQDRKNGAAGGREVTTEAVELALEGTAEGCDPLRGPGREVRQRAGAHLAAFAEGFTQEHGGWRMAIGHSRARPANHHAITRTGFHMKFVCLHAYIVHAKSL